MSSRAERTSLLLLVCAALASSIFWARTQPTNGADSESYLAPARNLIAGRGFSSPDPISYAISEIERRNVTMPDTFRTPGYPLLLAGVIAASGNASNVIPIQIALHVATALGLLLFVRRQVKDIPTAHLAGWLYALYPPAGMLAGQVMSETLYAASVLAAIAFTASLLRARDGVVGRALAAGLAVGVTVMIRPVTHFLFIPLTVLVIAALPSRRWAAGAIFAASAFVLPAMWMARNERVSGVATISSNAGDDMLFWRATGALAAAGRPAWYAVTALQLDNDYQRTMLRLHRKLLEGAKRRMRADGVDPDTINHARRSEYYGRLGRRLVMRQIGSYGLVAVSACVTLFVDVYRLPPMRAGLLHPATAAAVLVPFALVLLVSAVAGFAALLKRNRSLALLTLTVVAYFTIISASGGTDIRYAIPMAPMYCLAIAAGVRFRALGERAA